jgi:mono/diheme cytochrome c family protein
VRCVPLPYRVSSNRIVPEVLALCTLTSLRGCTPDPTCSRSLVSQRAVDYHERDMNRSNVILIIVLLVSALAILATASLLHNGLSSRATPTSFEAMLARNARHMAIPASAREQQNPVPASPEILRDARLHFADHCATCHGNEGAGDTMIGKGLYPKPPDLRAVDTQKLSDGELFWIIENGVRFTGMPAFGGTHGSQDDSWKLVRFIRHLPQLSSDERVEMERYNPKGPGDRKEENDEEDFLRGKPVQQKPESEHHH